MNADEVANMDKSQMAMARMLSVATYESGSLYTGLPNTVDGTRLSDTELTMAVGLRLGVVVAALSTCICGATLDELGHHALTCNRGLERFRRHEALNQCIRSMFSAAGHAALLEPRGLSASDDRRPDGITVSAVEGDKPAAWDATVNQTCAPSHLRTALSGPCALADHAAKLKVTKYCNLSFRYKVVPFAVETYGAMFKEAQALTDALSKKAKEASCDRRVRMLFYRRVQAAVQGGNARTELSFSNI